MGILSFTNETETEFYEEKDHQGSEQATLLHLLGTPFFTC